MAHWSGIGIPKTNAIALEVSYTHIHTPDYISCYLNHSLAINANHNPFTNELSVYRELDY